MKCLLDANRVVTSKTSPVINKILKAAVMQFIPNNSLLNYKPDTLEFLRKQYGFDTLKRVDDAIDILEKWIAKQDHFEMKIFDKGYLERMLIYNKGSVEKCKKKLDKLCTLRTLIPEFFTTKKIDKKIFFGFYSDVLLRQMTPDYGRVHFTQLRGQKFDTEDLVEYSKYYVLIYKYLQMVDYCNHVTYIVDFRNINILEYMKGLDIGEVRKSVEIAFDGFSLRFKAFHVITSSRAIEVFLALMKPMIGQKLSEKIQVHRTIDTVFEYVPKEIFPKDYGGNDKSLSELSEDLYNELYSEKFTEFRRQMNKGRTNELLRQKDKFNEEYLGISGSFRTLSVD